MHVLGKGNEIEKECVPRTCTAIVALAGGKEHPHLPQRRQSAMNFWKHSLFNVRRRIVVFIEVNKVCVLR